MARYLAQIVVLGTRIVSQAFIRALQQEYQATKIASQSGGASNAASKQTNAMNLKTGLSLQEAIQILNISPKLDLPEIETRYKQLFEANDKTKGGSFYIQSKVVRAKERLEAELSLQKNTERLKNKPNETSSDGG